MNTPPDTGSRLSLVPPATVDPIDAVLATLKETHGDGNVVAVNTQAGWIAFRKPKKAEYDRHVGMLMDDKQKPKAIEALACITVVYPSRAEFDAILVRLPGVVLTCADALTELAGFTEKAETKK
jgi:hypothetical protein